MQYMVIQKTCKMVNLIISLYNNITYIFGVACGFFFLQTD